VEDGTLKPIEQIEVGERVLAYDEATAAVVPAAVTQVFVHRNWQDQPTLLINGRLRATENHPFFVGGRWLRADGIHAGDLLLGQTPVPIDRGPTRTLIAETVEDVAPMPGVDTVYNLEIESFHTYFAEGILVHNIKTE
jgi:hypothetical protein